MRSQGRLLVVVVTCLGWGIPAVAGAQRLASRPCPVENASVTVSFNGMDTAVSAVRARLDAKVAEVKALAQEQSFTKFVVQSYNYNINSNYNSGSEGAMRFQYNANISFSILPADKAADFMQLLSKKGYQTGVNVSSYAGNNCAEAAEK